MRLHFDYELKIAFSQPVSRHTFRFRFLPPCDASQQLWGVDTVCSPASRLALSCDAFDNRCLISRIEPLHSSLNLQVSGEALVTGKPLEAPCSMLYGMQTPLTACDERMKAMGRGLTGTAEERALEAAVRLRRAVEYRKGVTDERTSAVQALDLGCGVCQDMAHLLLGILREQGMPARYVAGLIPGEGETHAWVEVYDGKRFIGIDPTHLCRTDDSYLRVNTGRDSRDCAINRGVFSGAAVQSMCVAAKMTQT